MIDIIQGLLLGIVQGITEWLPVSSSGHLAIIQHYLGISVPIAFDVMLHFASLIVIIVFFRKDIKQIVYAALRRDFKSEEGLLFLFVVVGTIITGIIGVSLKHVFASFFSSMAAVGGALIVTGAILALSRLGKGEKPLSLKSATLAGILQGFAVAPGLSRSGATIGGMLFAGIGRQKAIRFSFLLAIPAILGATALEADELALSGIAFESVAVGFIASAVVSYFSLKILMRIVMDKKFSWFAPYCFALGIALLILG
jgi:undecaprenyl-diphosphatase